jgi:NAD(P)-dependent dehydrogenase (short-subunit alcohol dehydrogenase family)
LTILPNVAKGESMGKASEDQRAVLITGASSGIGAACALSLAARGLRVYAGVRREADGEGLVAEAAGELVPVALDVTDRAQIDAVAARIRGERGGRGLNGLVHSAGILVSSPIEFVAAEQLRRQFEVNVFGTVAVTQAVLALLREARGRIVTIGSIAGRAAPPYFGPYAATKHALEAFTDSLRMELRHWGIGVSLIEPDAVATPIWGKLQSAPEQQTLELSPEARRLYGDDVDAMAEASQKMDRRGMPVDRVVRAVHHALTAPRPKTRYPLGFRTRLAAWAVGRVPDRIRDWYMLRELGMK